MGRKQQFNYDQFINATLELITDSGPGAVTVSSIAKRINAPIGSVYHRFSSRELIVAELWLGIAQSFQKGFLETLKSENIVQASLYTLDWVRKYPRESKVLLLYRREELMNAEWPDQVKTRAINLKQELSDGIMLFVQQLFGILSPESVERTVFALIDVPLAAVRRYLEAEETPPSSVDDLVKETCEHILRRVL